MVASIHLLCVGKMKRGPEQDLLTRYTDRARATGKQLGLGKITITEFPESRAGTAEARKAEEAGLISARIPDGSVVVVLDERGKAISTRQFSQILSAAFGQARPICFVIGGADGLDPSLREKADHCICFGAMTVPHQIARILLAEQIYRGTTVLTNHPYHRD